jgi:hypothetical protein
MTQEGVCLTRSDVGLGSAATGLTKCICVHAGAISFNILNSSVRQGITLECVKG